MSTLLPVLDPTRSSPVIPPAPASFDLEDPPPIVDAEGRRYEYLRLSVTDRCDLACRYCMPKGGEDDHALRPELMTFEENARLVAILGRAGVKRVRFTGGEPLVRKGFVDLVSAVHRAAPTTELVLTSNATRLEAHAHALAAAGLSGVNISLDSLDPARFRAITRGGDLARVVAGIEASVDAGLEVKLNTVAMRGVNDDELGSIVDWAWARGMTPRFIELMPLGEGAKIPDAFLSADDVVARLGGRVAPNEGAAADTGRGPARYLKSPVDDSRRVGVISAVSASFCESCNRVRVTGRGDLRVCLASQRALSIRDLLRSGAADRDVAWAIHWALAHKSSGHDFDRSGAGHEDVGMSLVGG